MWVQCRAMLCNAVWIMCAITWRKLYGCMLSQVVLNKIGSELILRAALFILDIQKLYWILFLITKWNKWHQITKVLVIRTRHEHSIEENNLCCRYLKIKFSFCPIFVIFEGRLCYCAFPVITYPAAAAESVTSRFYRSFGVNSLEACNNLLFVFVHRAANWSIRHIARFYFDVMATKVNHASYCMV